jgi:hypothetical protein
MNVCPSWKLDHLVVAYVGSANLGLGFYHLEVLSVESTKWLNMTNCGVVSIKSGQISFKELERELSEIYSKDWLWQIRELEARKFLVRFTPRKKVSDIKNYPSLNLRKEGVQVEVLEWNGDLHPFGELQEVWVQMTGTPPKLCHWKVFAQIASGFGLMLEVDWTNLFKTFYEVVRVKIASKYYKKIPKNRLFEFNKKLRVVSFLVEGTEDEDVIKSSNGGDDGGDDDVKDDGLDDKGNEDGYNDEEADDPYDDPTY